MRPIAQPTGGDEIGWKVGDKASIKNGELVQLSV